MSLVSLGETPLLVCHKPGTIHVLEGPIYVGETPLLVLFLTWFILLMSILLRRSVLCLSMGITPSKCMLLGVLCSLLVLNLGSNIHLPIMLAYNRLMLGQTLFFTSRCITPLLIWGDHMVGQWPLPPMTHLISFKIIFYLLSIYHIWPN